MAASEIVSDIESYLTRLFPLCRSITGEPNRETLRILQEIIPITIHEVPSGTPVYDWTVPDEWNISDAWIENSDGERLLEFSDNNLHVVSYSQPIESTIDWSELEPHLHVHDNLPDAIPYRTSYYKKDWGFCLTAAQYNKIRQCGGPYRVKIDSRFTDGSLTYGEILLQGTSQTEVLISCYICHPSMANDSLSGVILTAFLARYIASLQDRQWSYRVIFVPETIGAIAYCALHESEMKNIDTGMVVTTVGGPGEFGYKQSLDSSHTINRLVQEVFTEAKVPYKTYPFDIHGSDERQYSSQGFGINAVTICRDRYYEYPFYHSSLDDLKFVTANQISETLELYEKLIDRIETQAIFRSTKPNCEVMLSRHGLYPDIGGAQSGEKEKRTDLDLILWLLFLCNGKRSIQDIAIQLEVSESRLWPLVDNLVDKEVLERV